MNNPEAEWRVSYSSCGQSQRFKLFVNNEFVNILISGNNIYNLYVKEDDIYDHSCCVAYLMQLGYEYYLETLKPTP